MSEKILNTNFSDGPFDHWNNGVNQNPFVYNETHKAYAVGVPGELKKFDIVQSFSSNDEVIDGSVRIHWWRYNSYEGRYCRLIVELEKPDTSKVTLIDEEREDETSTASWFINEDITAYFTQYGTYKLWISIWVNDGSQSSIRQARLPLVVKKYKSVHEKIGGTGRLNDVASVKKAEIIGLVESYSTEVHPGQFTSASEIMGLVEGTSMLITRRPSVAESIGLVEGLQAVRTQGNLVTTYAIEDLMQWSDVSPTVTPWIKTKIIT